MRNTEQDSEVTISLSGINQADWYALVVVLIVAVVLRLLFYTGFFGSDEVTYVEVAANIAAGDWHASNYIGATRYGMNLPVALFIYLFGLSEASANLWPLLCSVGEVAVVFIIARWLWSTRVATLSALLLALLPLHVHFAGRMMADPPLAFFLTLSVALLLRATFSRYWITFFAAGLAWGGVFWVKESVGLLYAPVFLILHLHLNSFHKRPLLWLIAGMAFAVVANCALMYFVADNPLHVFAVMKKVVVVLAANLTLAESPWYYLRYLFLDIRHTFLLGFLTLAAVIFYAKRFLQNKNADRGTQFVVLWVLLLLGMFSLAVVSFSPVKLVMKQTNYMLIFVGPMTLLAGWYLASLPRRLLLPLGVVIATGSLVLAALEQQAIAVFTANSKAAYAFLRDQPDAFLVGTTNNERAVNFFTMIESRGDLRKQMLTFSEMATIDLGDPLGTLVNHSAGKNVFALVDLQNIGWGNNKRGIRQLGDVPKCWTPMGTLTPVQQGIGGVLTTGMFTLSSVLPASFQQRYLSILEPVTMPAQAHLFRVGPSCLTKVTK